MEIMKMEVHNQAIMEIELNSEDQKIEIPKFIDIIKEVTEEEKYKNKEMAKRMVKAIAEI